MLPKSQIYLIQANKYIKKHGSFLSRRFISHKIQNEKLRKIWKPTVGLEIHAQLATKSKLFSGASIEFTKPNNSNVSFYDCATPGTLPILNRRCVELTVMTALALSCQLNEISFFERKHYFYPDLPAGFQITQQRKPIAINGEIQCEVYTPGYHKTPYPKTSKIKQIQLEQDSGRSLHDENRSFIDLNRAGIPLIEFVFEPDLVDGEEAAAVIKELSLILRLLGVCTAKMEEGALRVDANVSVSNTDENLGVRTEIKNIGSTRSVAAAIASEINRQISILEAGGKIFNETRAWDARNKTTTPMRVKEDKDDYRFMPETNLPPLRIHIREDLENKDNLIDAILLKRQLPELPEETRQRLKNVLNVPSELIVALMSDLALVRLFNRIIQKNEKRKAQLVAKVLVNEILTFVNKNKLTVEFCISHEDFIGQIIDLLQAKAINIHTAKKLLDKLILDPKEQPKEIVEKHDWFIISDEKRLKEICLVIVEKNPELVSAYKKGKTNTIQTLMKKVGEATEERADMAAAVKIMEKLLKL